MPRKGSRFEEELPFKILALIPDTHPGARWKEIKSKVIEAELCSPPTLSSQLLSLERGRYILHEGVYYRRNPTRNLLRQTRRFSGQPVAEKLRMFQDAYKNGLQRIDLWQEPPESIKLHNEKIFNENAPRLRDEKEIAHPLNLENDKELKLRIELSFNYIYAQYVRMLTHLVTAPSKAAAREYVELFVKIEAHTSLSMFANMVWKNRTKVQLKKLEGTALRLQTGQGLLPQGFTMYPRDSLFDLLNY